MMLEEFLSKVEEAEKKATKSPQEVGIVSPKLDPIEWFRQHLSFGSGDIWAVHCPSHPKAVGPEGKPDHAILSAITGNGPDSQANAEFYALSRSAVPVLCRLVREISKELNHCAPLEMSAKTVRDRVFLIAHAELAAAMKEVSDA